jgi:hypothetical protein
LAAFTKHTERKDETMIARLDHHPMLTALLALTTAVLVVVVITLATLLIMASPPAATSSSESGANPGAIVQGTGENYGEGWNNYGDNVLPPKPAQKGDSVAPHQDIPSAHYGL